MTEAVYLGGCLCGDVRYRAEGKPLFVSHCHCRSCRRSSGAAITTCAGFDRDHFEFTGDSPVAYESSPGVTRNFCGNCGSPVTYVAERVPDEVHVWIGTFDDASALIPDRHVFWKERISWMHADDGVPKYAKLSRDGEKPVA